MYLVHTKVSSEQISGYSQVDKEWSARVLINLTVLAASKQNYSESHPKTEPSTYQTRLTQAVMTIILVTKRPADI